MQSGSWGGGCPAKRQAIPKRFVPTKRKQASLSHPKSMNHTAGLWERERMLFFGILEDFPFVPTLSVLLPPTPNSSPIPQHSRTFFLLHFYFPRGLQRRPGPSPPRSTFPCTTRVSGVHDPSGARPCRSPASGPRR